MLKISDSPNIAVLDIESTIDLCVGKIFVNLDPSIWITGIGSVLGVKFEIVNPYGVAIRPYGAGYDTPPFEFPVPTQAGNYQYGKYTIKVKLYDSTGTEYEEVKTISICAPNTLDKTKKYGSVGAKLTGVCNDGKVYVLVDNVPVYNGAASESTTQSFVFDYPTAALPSFATTYGSFAAELYEGVYKIKGDICATYNFGDNSYVKVMYKVEYDKAIICALDECCVFEGLQVLHSRLHSDCSAAEKKETQQNIDAVTLLLDTIDFGVRCGDDISEYIFQLEKILTVSCGCSFNNGTPITNSNPAEDLLIQGCNVTKTVIGLTTVYQIDNYEYNVDVQANGGALTVTPATLNGCVQTQELVFNIDIIYAQIKGKANADFNSWGAVIMKSLTGLDTACLDINPTDLAAMSYKTFTQKLVDKVCSGVSTCAATINTASVSQSGANAVISWASTGAFSSDIFVDGVLKATVLGGVTSYTLAGYADGLQHTYKVFAKCANGSTGTFKDGVFGFTGCPSITAPSVSSTNVTAQCPYNLTGLVMSLPMGITAEWHKANNTLASSLVDPTSVSDGSYYVFATNGANCYSTGVKVTVICQQASSCTAPQALAVSPMLGGLLVAFQSAAYPPPSNSYTVQRKDQSQPDGSYMTMGNATFNVSTSKWEYKDLSAVSNKYYSYRAISNCTGGGKSVSIDYVNITCANLILTVTKNSIGYSFVPLGGDIDQYIVELYDGITGVILDSDTYTPTFANPVTGSFTALTAGTDYKVRVRSYVSTQFSTCPVSNVRTNDPKIVTLVIQNESLDMSLTSIDIDTVVPTLIGGGLPVSTNSGRTSQDIFSTTVDVYLEWNNNLSTQSVTVYDTQGMAVCLAESLGTGHVVTGVDNTGELPIRVVLNAAVC